MARVIQVIDTEERVGFGVQGSPVRRVKQFWSLDGELLIERDDWKQERMAELARGFISNEVRPASQALSPLEELVSLILGRELM